MVSSTSAPHAPYQARLCLGSAPAVTASSSCREQDHRWPLASAERQAKNYAKLCGTLPWVYKFSGAGEKKYRSQKEPGG